MMSNYMPAEGYRIYPIKGYHGFFHLLHDVVRKEAVLVDAGLVGEMPRLAGALKEAKLTWRDIKAILLTHGHLDHTGNLAQLKELTRAPVLAHPLEQPHIDGVYPYRGLSRVCGAMEAVGRRLFRYRPVPIDEPLVPDEELPLGSPRWLSAGAAAAASLKSRSARPALSQRGLPQQGPTFAELPYWGGLRVVHLPGHTAGHCGFFSERFDLLFSGDLFADYGFSTHLPPPFLNSCPELLPASLKKVQALSPRLIIPNHYGRLDPERHRRRFNALAARHALRIS